MALVDDGLVDTEKIGTSVYFWSLPSKALAVKAKQVAKLQTDLAAAQKQNSELAKALEELREQHSSQEKNEERREELVANAQEMMALRNGLVSQLSAFQVRLLFGYHWMWINMSYLLYDLKTKLGYL